MDSLKDSSKSDGISRGEDESNTITTEQPSAPPVTVATGPADTAPAATPSEPMPQVDGAGESTIRSAPLEPVIELRVHRTDTSQEDLDEEAVILMKTIRECILNCNTLTGLIASGLVLGQGGAAHPFQPEIAKLDATTSYLISILNHSAHAQALPIREQVLRRVDVQSRYNDAIRKLLRLPAGERECGPDESRAGDAALHNELYPQRSVPLGHIHSSSDDSFGDQLMAREIGAGQELEVDDSGLDGSGWLYEVD